ncbi:MAG: hypothetical protein IKA34_10360 [Bacteroidales bacterium]|nr:hypothetical protein [Bacteroidales bacterium]
MMVSAGQSRRSKEVSVHPTITLSRFINMMRWGENPRRCFHLSVQAREPMWI